MVFDELQKERIYTEYSVKVFRYVRAHVSQYSAVEDIVSDIFVKIFQGLSGFDETKASLSTWIYRISQNTVTDYYRKRRVFSEIPQNAVAEGGEVDDGLLAEEALEQLADALQALDNRSRKIIILHYYSRKSLKDIAEKLGISYIYTKQLHKKALLALKNLLQ